MSYFFLIEGFIERWLFCSCQIPKSLHGLWICISSLYRPFTPPWIPSLFLLPPLTGHAGSRVPMYYPRPLVSTVCRFLLLGRAVQSFPDFSSLHPTQRLLNPLMELFLGVNLLRSWRRIEEF